MERAQRFALPARQHRDAVSLLGDTLGTLSSPERGQSPSADMTPRLPPSGFTSSAGEPQKINDQPLIQRGGWL